MPRNQVLCKECGNITIKISWSQLRTHEECKQRSWLQRSGKKAHLEDYRNFFPGTVTDRVVRAWLLEDPEDNLGRMPSMVEAIMEEEEQKIMEGKGTLKWKSLSDRAEVREECIKAVTLIEPDLQELVIPYDYTPDFGFQVPMDLPHPSGGFGQAVLHGFMDILVRDDKGQFQVWDVKHTKNNDYWRKTEGQLTFYDLAVSTQFDQGTSVTGLLQPLCNEPVRKFTITPDKRAQMLQRIMSMATDIWQDEHPPREDNKYCSYCSVKHACAKFKPTMVNGKRRLDF